MRIYRNLYCQSLGLFRSNGSKLSAPSLQKFSTLRKRQKEATDIRSTESQTHDDDDNDCISKPYVHPTLKEKSAAREPFVKNLFLGKFDKVMLEYPEVLYKERQELLHGILSPTEEFFNNEVDSEKIDKESRIPPETLQGLKDLGLFGMEIPVEDGGLGLCETEMARLFEVIGSDSSINVTLGAHQSLGIKSILLYGTSAQKARYLPRLASGEWTAAFALTEASGGSDAELIMSEAEVSINNKNVYILNGKKLWVLNGSTADLFIVFAKVRNLETNKDEPSALIVERNFGGVTSGKPINKHGMRGANIAEVQFDNTSIPVENLLHTKGEGFKVAIDTMGSSGCAIASSCIGSLKKLMRLTVAHAVNRKQFGKTLSEFMLIRKKLAMMAMDIYAMESMVYLTTGLIDLLDKQDTVAESAIVKVFSSEKTCLHSLNCLQIMGSDSLLTGSAHERHFRDSQALNLMNGTNDILRLLISLSSLQHAGQSLREDVIKLRNPFMHPVFKVKHTYENYRAQSGKHSLNLGLGENVHPSLIKVAEQIEYSVRRFAFAVVCLFEQHGRDVSNPRQQLDLERLSNTVIDIYAMTAVMARASRSYCIGLHNSDHEILLCSYFCNEAKDRISKYLDDVCGDAVDEDKVLDKIADSLFDKKGYAATHPMTRVFW